jgi:hypothetical protein
LGATATYINCLTNRTPDQRKEYCKKEYDGIPGLNKKCRVNNNLYRLISVISVVIEVLRGHIKTTCLLVKEDAINHLKLVIIFKKKNGKKYALM